jgi:hypothetical protein
MYKGKFLVHPESRSGSIVSYIKVSGQFYAVATLIP